VFRRHHIQFAWHITIRTYRVLTWVVLIAGLAFALAMLGLRYYVFPDMDRYRSWMEAGVTRAAGQRVTIARASGSWDGYRPSVKLEGVVVFDGENRPALELGHVEAVLAWRSILLREVRLHALVIDRPDLKIRRDAAGVVSIAGFPVNTGGPESGFLDWLLAQQEVQVRSATLTWIDEARGAPPLTLSQVDLHLDNGFRRHRFGLRMVPPVEMASVVDVRGDLQRRSQGARAGLRGKLYARCGYVNLGAGKRWIDLPVDIESGAADAEIWAEFADAKVTEVTGDVRVAALSARLGSEAKALELSGLQGRLGFLRTAGGYDLSGRRLSLVLGNGDTLGPTDVVFRQVRGGRSQLQADRLNLAPIASLAQTLPLDPALHARLAELAPRGQVEDLRLAWDADAKRPEQFELEARVIGLALKGSGDRPGVSGLSGRVMADRHGGKVELDSSNVTVRWPAQFELPLALDWIKAKVGWTYAAGGPQVELQRLALANGDLAASASGSFRATETGPGVVDLTAAVGRLDARSLGKYVPLAIGSGTRHWLAAAFEAGSAKDARLRLQGDLADFPFDQPGKAGLFEITTNVEGVRLRFAPDWPLVEEVRGQFALRGHRIEVNATGSILGVALDPTSVVLPDFLQQHPVLEIKGGAQGETQAFLRFIDSSPVGNMIGGLAKGTTAKGAGRLALDLRVPLDHGQDTTVAGSFQFMDNRIEGSEFLPELANLNATLNFTQAGAKVVNATANVFDMPARFSVATEPGGVVNASATGRANMARLQRAIDAPWLRYFEGDTDWKLRLGVRKGITDITVESDLVGVTSKLPPPLAKAPAAPMALRVQRRSRGGNQTLQVSLAQRLSVALAMESSGKNTRVERGEVRFGTGAKLPASPGVTVSGAFDRIDVDAWLDVQQAAQGKAGDGGGSLELTGVDLKVKEVEIFGRVIHDVGLVFRHKNDRWNGAIASREVVGDVEWNPSGRGRLLARLARLHVPDADAQPGNESGEQIAGRDLPAIDVTADSFQFGAMDFGMLALLATPNGPVWQIEKLNLENPDFQFSATGAWQSVRGTGRTQIAAKLDVTDIGRFLRRLGRPEGIAGGTVHIEGPLEWEGIPYRLDYATLRGSLKLDARKGRFVKLEPGIGRLLGVLSLQSLPRRVSLDFGDIFREGFAFERITGDLGIERGVIRTENLKMVGTSAKVSMKGDVDLVAETQALEIRVVPSISDSVAVGTAIVNPAVGLATFLVGKVLKDPLDQFIAFEYKVTGGWTEPVVTKVVRQLPEPPRGSR